MKMKILAVADGGGGVGGLDDFTMPDFNLADLQGETPEWLKWIVDHKEELLGFLSGLATFIKLIKWGVDGIKALGIGLMVWRNSTSYFWLNFIFERTDLGELW